MRRTMLIAAAVTMASPLMLGEASAASTQVPQMQAAQSAAAAGAIVEKAGYRHCARWNYRCHRRWGWGWKYRRCMVRHGC